MQLFAWVRLYVVSALSDLTDHLLSFVNGNDTPTDRIATSSHPVLFAVRPTARYRWDAMPIQTPADALTNSRLFDYVYNI